MSKCDCYHVVDNPMYFNVRHECWGTKEREECDCGGDTDFCTHYPEKRKKEPEYQEISIIAVDFDGTLCENCWPDIGIPNRHLIEELIEEKKKGTKLILWTCREGKELDLAVHWCSYYGLEFDAVNENLPEIIRAFGQDTRKIFAHRYIDDRADCKHFLPFTTAK